MGNERRAGGGVMRQPSTKRGKNWLEGALGRVYVYTYSRGAVEHAKHGSMLFGLSIAAQQYDTLLDHTTGRLFSIGPKLL